MASRDRADDAAIRRLAALKAAARRPGRPMPDPLRPAIAAKPPARGGGGGASPCSVFVSYSREDSALVEVLVAQLRAGGVTVRWDRDFSAGVDFGRAILEEIEAARAVIVVWSPASVRSRFVVDEAGVALEAGKLIATHVAGFDFASLPIGFRRCNATPLDDRRHLAASLAALGVEGVWPMGGRSPA